MKHFCCMIFLPLNTKIKWRIRICIKISCKYFPNVVSSVTSRWYENESCCIIREVLLPLWTYATSRRVGDTMTQVHNYFCSTLHSWTTHRYLSYFNFAHTVRSQFNSPLRACKHRETRTTRLLAQVLSFERQTEIGINLSFGGACSRDN